MFPFQKFIMTNYCLQIGPVKRVLVRAVIRGLSQPKIPFPPDYNHWELEMKEIINENIYIKVHLSIFLYKNIVFCQFMFILALSSPIIWMMKRAVWINRNKTKHLITEHDGLFLVPNFVWSVELCLVIRHFLD